MALDLSFLREILQVVDLDYTELDKGDKMPRFKMVNGERIQFTAEEEAARDAEEKAWADGAPARRMADLRQQRNQLLAETDWMGNSDVTMSADWKTYRQALRDITKQTPADDELSNITWPTKPE
tara:strand:+ start:44 stop:415 length:372 start_codon:yes stop_codon:yes gene_type:complete